MAKDVTIYIDGRPSRVSGEQLNALLSSIQGDNIARIEVFTNSSSRYDAAGWSFSNDLTARDTACRAYEMALRNRRAEPGMIFHSDRGVQYASKEFRNTLAKNVVQSMSRKGNCWDNDVAESFFKSLKCEMIYGNQVLSAEDLELEVFEWIEIWYNKIRRHKALGNMTITEFWNLNKISA